MYVGLFGDAEGNLRERKKNGDDLTCCMQMVLYYYVVDVKRLMIGCFVEVFKRKGLKGNANRRIMMVWGEGKNPRWRWECLGGSWSMFWSLSTRSYFR